MGDWADEVVERDFHPMWTGRHAAPHIAAALREARADALEEAAVEAEWAAAFEVARNIRDLKDKTACG